MDDVIAYDEGNALGRVLPEAGEAAGVGVERYSRSADFWKRMGARHRPKAVFVATSHKGLTAMSKLAAQGVMAVPIPKGMKAAELATLLRVYARARGGRVPEAAPATSPALAHAAPELRAASGRLDAKRIAEHFGLRLKALATMVGRAYPAVQKTPDAPALQAKLEPFARIALAADRLLDGAVGLRAWLNAPHPDLDGASPLEVLESGKPEVLVDMLEDALAGHPT